MDICPSRTALLDVIDGIDRTTVLTSACYAVNVEAPKFGAMM